MDGDLSIHFENFVSLFCSDMCDEAINLTVTDLTVHCTLQPAVQIIGF